MKKKKKKRGLLDIGYDDDLILLLI